MFTKSNPAFTHSEMELMENSDLFYQKRQIIHKMTHLFGQTADMLKQLPQHKAFTFPKHTDITTGKISKGENYLQLPWLMLDFPRLFKPDTIFAYRIMFWWGNGFYLTLHLSGNALQRFEPSLLNNCHQLGNDHNLWFCTGNNPWQHQPDTQNYLPARQLTAQLINQQIAQHRFVKLTQSLPLAHYNTLKHHALQRYQFFLALLSN